MSEMKRPISNQTIDVPIAPGELIDKITILTIKSERISDPQKLANVRTELDLLNESLRRHVATSEKLTNLSNELKRVNEQLWQIEDDIRICERDRDFGAKFIELARSVYHTNDERARIKRSINELLGSKIVEEKDYEDYG